MSWTSPVSALGRSTSNMAGRNFRGSIFTWGKKAIRKPRKSFARSSLAGDKIAASHPIGWPRDPRNQSTFVVVTTTF